VDALFFFGLDSRRFVFVVGRLLLGWGSIIVFGCGQLALFSSLGVLCLRRGGGGGGGGSVCE